MKFKIITILLTLSMTWSFQSFGQFRLTELSNPNEVGLSNDSLQKMETHFHSLVDEKKLAGIQTAVLRKGKLVYFDSYGYLNIEKQTPITDTSIFRIFSMTKPIVSVALMQLYEQGNFELNDPLHQYISEFKSAVVVEDSILVSAKNPIRIIDLLRHTSGYNYGRNNNATLNKHYEKAELHTAQNNEEFVKKLSKIPLQFEPGTNWQYGYATNICGYLIEVLSGKSLDQYLNEYIFEPLEMNDTHFQLPKDKIQSFATGYRWNDERGLFMAERHDNNRFVNKVTLFNGGGGLVSTTFDYLKFCQMILNGGNLNNNNILKPETIDLMLSDHLESVWKQQTERLRLPVGEAGFGLGFAIRGENPNALEKVFGWGGAVGTYFKIDKEHNLAYVMMIQLSPHRQLELRSKIQRFINEAIIE